MADDQAFWAAARVGPVVITERTVEALQEELAQVRSALVVVLRALDQAASQTPAGTAGNGGLAAAVRRAQDLLDRPSRPA